MSYKFKQIGIIGRASRHNIEATLDTVCEFLTRSDISVLIDEETANLISHTKFSKFPKFPIVSRAEIGEKCDLAVVVGGDGSILHAARALAGYDISVIGIHQGRLGFLTDIAPDDITVKLDQVLKGEYKRHELFLLHANIIDLLSGKTKKTIDAVNEVVINSGSVTRMIEFEVYIDNQFVYSQRSDGLIISTPTGSTAYSLSGGGPILTPDLKVLVLVPMFPHNLTSRPIVICNQSQIKVIPMNNSFNLGLSCDGQEVELLTENDAVEIYKSNKVLHLLHPKDYNYYETLRTKLHWGAKLV
ncbi:MAG: NAD(+) kinase [Gammaproteobacteria bacterium]|nr:NAD(+) kinase [Gammaproteobacteria bacterium]